MSSQRSASGLVATRSRSSRCRRWVTRRQKSYAEPRTDWLSGAVARDEKGFVYTGPDLLSNGTRPAGWDRDRDPFYLECSVPGIFAAGDVRANSVKRVASAVGEGAMAVTLVHRYLEAQ